MKDLKQIVNTALYVAWLVYHSSQWENVRGLNTSASNCIFPVSQCWLIHIYLDTRRNQSLVCRSIKRFSTKFGLPLWPRAISHQILQTRANFVAKGWPLQSKSNCGMYITVHKPCSKSQDTLLQVQSMWSGLEWGVISTNARLVYYLMCDTFLNTTYFCSELIRTLFFLPNVYDHTILLTPVTSS